MTTEYEVTYILRPGLEEADADARTTAIAEIVRSGGGEVLAEPEKMGKRRLAYEIDDVREGYYVVMRFKADAAGAKELDRQLRLNEDVLRGLIIRADELPQRAPAIAVPAPMGQAPVPAPADY